MRRLDEFTLRRLQSADGSWERFDDVWSEQCQEHGEDYESYGLTWRNVLRDLATSKEPGTFVYSLYHNETPVTVFFANWTSVKGYREKILRIRHLVVSPDIDFGNYPASFYGEVNAMTFAKALALSNSNLMARHIRFHLRSPEDARFYAIFGSLIVEQGVVKTATSKGAWLFVEK